MSNVRPRVMAACVIFLLVGVAGTTISLLTLVRGQGAVGLGLVFGAFALFVGILLVLILSKDPARTGGAVLVGPSSNAHVLQFTVGQSETHQISYRWDQVWGWLTVTVDGALVAKSLVTLSFRLVRVTEFEVGTDEKHAVRIEKRRRLVGAFAQPQPITAYVDGNIVATHDGATAH